MKYKTIFIAGPHGSGKGHLSKFLEKSLNIPSFSASNLIKQEKNRPIDIDKIAIDAGNNQDYLILAMEKIVTNSKLVMIDGHFSLLISNGFFDVPESTFEKMNLSCIVLKTADAELIQSRLSNRDGKTMDIVNINELQMREVARAKEISENLEVPLLILPNDNYTDAVDWIKLHNA